MNIILNRITNIDNKYDDDAKDNSEITEIIFDVAKIKINSLRNGTGRIIIINSYSIIESLIVVDDIEECKQTILEKIEKAIKFKYSLEISVYDNKLTEFEIFELWE